ncbi:MULTISPECIES: type IV secretion system protein TraC [Pantoea]|uniref:Protein TraC n=1 Tax=Pantoea ananas TaxID=553 RepID=A0AAJ1FSV3_PANAN|nr:MULTISPECIES: type IV secretion system protein TraC [Pantoea]MCW0345839.1 Protein TraC [Pantoea ananatis]MDC7872147.1 type IV secretion system protein TraC [Pantoea ananatis]OWY74814.1 type-IV secretion system protein TraC [Pantoea sp. AMG 501]
MANKWLDQLAGILENGRQVSGAKEASALLQQNFSYPSLSSLLPWRMYDGQSDLYINGRSVGFMLELSPLIGANQQVVQGLDTLLREKLPRKTPLTVMMVASKCVGGMLQQALSVDMWKGPMAPRLNAITRAYWERAALKGFTNQREYPLYLRNYRVFLVYAQSGRGGISGMDEVSRVRDSVTMALKGSYMDCRRIQPGEFLSVMREQLNHRPGQVTASDGYWNPDQELHRQAVHPSTELEVYPGYLRMLTARQPEDRRLDKNDDSLVSATRIVSMQLSEAPKQFALWQGADNLQNMRFPELGIPCPFILSWTVVVEDQMQSQNEAFRKEQDLAKKVASTYARLFPDVERSYREWKELRQGLSTNEISMCDINFNLTLFTPDSDKEQQFCEVKATNVFSKNGLQISSPKMMQLRNWLTTLPFVVQEGLWDDMKRMGATLRCKTFNAANLMPVVAERQMSEKGSPLPTYRNQLAFFDMFEKRNGATNSNIAVTGTTGAGKSFFIQELLRQVLNSGGYGWVIDMGESYKNFCHQAGGVYLDGASLRFNPFANITDVTDMKRMAERVKGLLAVLANPAGELDQISESVLLKAVNAAWEAKQNRARIDDVVYYLKSDAVQQEYGQQPTIMSRIHELVLLLDQWCTWGTNGEYFNSDNPTLNSETRFAVLEMLSLESQPHLLSAILYSLILAIQDKMYHSSRKIKKLAVIDEAWRLFSGHNPHAARFIETGYRTVRRHMGAFITITQGISDFTGLPEQPAPSAAAAAWNCSGTKVTLLQDNKALTTYLNANPDQFSEMETQIIRGFEAAGDTGFSSVMMSTGKNTSFHRVFTDPITRAMFSSEPSEFQYMADAQKAGATSEEAAYMLASEPFKFGQELAELELWAGLRKPESEKEKDYA